MVLSLNVAILYNKSFKSTNITLLEQIRIHFLAEGINYIHYILLLL